MDVQASSSKDSEESAQSDELLSMETVCKELDDKFLASSALKVFLRIRPRVGGRTFTNPAFQPCDDKTVESTAATLEHQHQKRFSFTKVFPEGSSQQELFEEAVRNPVDAFIDGANVLLFAYGPTAGGKTYTMQGTPANPGVVPRTLDRLFKALGPQVCKGAPARPECFNDVALLSTEEEASALLLKNKLLGEKGARGAEDFNTFNLPASDSDGPLMLSRDSNYSYGGRVQVLIWLSFYEIYNEGIYDLLLPSLEAATKKKRGQRRPTLKLGEDRAKRSFVRGVIEVPVHSADEAHRLLCLACKNQSIAETQLNHSSSRSHCIFTVRIVNYNVDSRDGSKSWHVNTLMLCDLAGSERASKSGTDGQRLREAGRINTSLLVLSRCLEGLRNNQDAPKKAPVPFRESKLTKVMQAYFTTGGQVSLIVNISPALSTLEESLNALKFSAVAIEVVPQRLELRRTRCKEAARRLTERWNLGMFSATPFTPIPDMDVAATGALDAGEAEELFETIEAQRREIEALEQELKDTRSQLAWERKMVAAHKAEVGDYEDIVKSLEKSLHAQRERLNHEMAVRIENACEITRLQMNKELKAERNSVMELLESLEKANDRIAELEKALTEQRTAQDDSTTEDGCEELQHVDIAAVEAKEEKQSHLQQALKSAVEHVEDEGSDENCPRRSTRSTRRTIRATWSMATSGAPSELSDNFAHFKALRRTTSRVKKSVLPPDDALEEEQQQHDHRAVLADSNAESSPLKRLATS